MTITLEQIAELRRLSETLYPRATPKQINWVLDQIPGLLDALEKLQTKYARRCRELQLAAADKTEYIAERDQLRAEVAQWTGAAEELGHEIPMPDKWWESPMLLVPAIRAELQHHRDRENTWEKKHTEDTTSLRRSLAQRDQQIHGRDRYVSELRDELAQALAEVEKLKAQNEQLCASLNEVQDPYIEALAERNRLRDELRTHQHKTRQLEDYSGEVIALRAEVARLTAELQSNDGCPMCGNRVCCCCDNEEGTHE